MRNQEPPRGFCPLGDIERERNTLSISRDAGPEVTVAESVPRTGAASSAFATVSARAGVLEAINGYGVVNGE